MKLIDNVLWIEFSEALEAGIPSNTISVARHRKSPSWSFMNDPADRRKVLIEYERMKPDYQKKIEGRFGNPYENVARQPIRNLIKWDNKAEEFFLTYRYGENKPLPIEHVKKYTGAANFLNMLRDVTADKKALKDLLKLTIEKFYTYAIEIITADSIDLPTSYRRLLAKRKDYETNGYASLIDWRFGNTLAAKVKDELSEATLLKMISHHNQYDDVFIQWQYNKWASENGYKAIDAATVGVWRRKKEHEIVMHREGNASLKNKFLRQAKGSRPSAPLYLVESDDNFLDLLFADPENPSADRRYVAFVVSDSYNDYPLGYSYYLQGSLSKGQTIDMIRAAYINAMYYVRSITGQWFLPHELKTDNWAIASLEPFYKSIGNYVKTPVGSKNRGFIEQMFGSPHWKRCLKAGAINYTGNNVTAKHRGVNMEALARSRKERPLIGDEATTQIESFFHRLRHMPQSNGISKHDQWLNAFNALPEESKRPANDEQFLLKFGIEHQPKNNELPRITNRGVEPQIGGIRYSYDIEGGLPMEHVGKKVHVLYDPFDMSRVLITDFEQVRLIGREARLSPRALADAHTGSRAYLNAILEEKKDAVERIAARSERRDLVLTEAGIDPETLLNSGVMVKEVKQDAERRMLSEMVEHREFNEDDLYEQM